MPECLQRVLDKQPARPALQRVLGQHRDTAVQTAGGLKRRRDGLPSDEVSFTVPDDEETLAAVIEATYEELVMSTRFKYPARRRDKLGEDNANKWWHCNSE